MEATAPAEAKQQVNVYSLVTDKIIEQLVSGNVPWQKVWTSGPPTNLLTRKPYYGINALLLGMEEYEYNFFLTFDQVHGLGGRVKGKSKGHALVYWKNAAEAKPGEKPQGQLKYYTVFNVAQCENIPEQYLSALSEPVTHLSASLIISSMPSCPVIQHREPTAWYDVVEDIVHMPKKSSSKKDDKYYATLFRQLVHSTGNDLRLARKGIVEMSEIASEPLYSKEDLVAEIGICFLLSMAGITPKPQSSPGYMQGWLAKFRQDKLLIFLAAKEAQRAVNYILDIKPEDTRHTAE